MSRALIIIPTYNEKDNIDSLLGGVFQSAPDVSVLFVDDNSQDGTADKVREWMAKNSNVNILEREGKLGLGSAYVAGFKWGLEKGFDQMIEMDADLSHKPIYLPACSKLWKVKMSRLAVATLKVVAQRIGALLGDLSVVPVLFMHALFSALR